MAQGSLLGMLTPVFNLLIGAGLFQERLTVISGVGMLLVLGAGMSVRSVTGDDRRSELDARDGIGLDQAVGSCPDGSARYTLDQPMNRTPRFRPWRRSPRTDCP